jgi:hypothetical protein
LGVILHHSMVRNQIWLFSRRTPLVRDTRPARSTPRPPNN